MRKFIILTIALFVPAIITGMLCKNSFKNYDDLSYYTVATADEELMLNVYKNIQTAEQNAAYILRVRCNKKSQFTFKRTYQEVEVLEVFKGNEGITKGSVINISPTSSRIFTDDNSINMGFINEMKIGKEYLVLLDEKEISVELKVDIYPTTNYIMTLIFCYEDIQNVVAEENYVSYPEVHENEVFTNSEEAMDLFLELKKLMTYKYK